MPITPFLDGQQFDTETKRIVGIAFEMARIALGLTERTDPINEIIAKRIIELAKTGTQSRPFVRGNFRERLQTSG
jgi:hypothetical protein